MKAKKSGRHKSKFKTRDWMPLRGNQTRMKMDMFSMKSNFKARRAEGLGHVLENEQS